MNLTNQRFQEILQNDPEAWAIRINTCWRKGIEAIIGTGRLLLDAKDACAHGDFTDMLANRLSFGERTAQRLMAIARDNRLTNPSHVTVLPAAYSTLAALTGLTDEEFERGIETGIINPEMERADVDLIRPKLQDSGVSGSPVRDNPRPHGESLQQGLDTSSNPGTAETSPRGEGSEAASVANPEDRPASAPRDPSGAPEAILPHGARAIMGSRQEANDSLDHFPTPPWATRALVEHVFPHLERRGVCKFQNAWEPACGKGHMAEVLREYFREVRATDIADYGYGDGEHDFLASTSASLGYDWIITNPPFNDKTEPFVLKALALAGSGVAMFVRLQWLEGVGRYERVYRDRPPTLVSFFAERVPLHKGQWDPDGSTATAYIWLVWLKGALPRAPFWIPPGCRTALTRPDDVKKFGKSIVEGEAA